MSYNNSSALSFRYVYVVKMEAPCAISANSYSYAWSMAVLLAYNPHVLRFYDSTYNLICLATQHENSVS